MGAYRSFRDRDRRAKCDPGGVRGGLSGLVCQWFFVAEARDDRYRSGYAGIAYATQRGESIVVEFDDFRVWEAD